MDSPQRLTVLDLTSPADQQGSPDRCFAAHKLSTAFITDIARRCGLYATVVGGAFLIGTIWHSIEGLLLFDDDPHRHWFYLHTLTIIALAVLIRLRARVPSSCPMLTIKLATLLQLYACAISAHAYVSLLDCSPGTEVRSAGLSWSAMMVVLYPLLVPGHRAYHWSMAVIGAAMVPVVWLVHDTCSWSAFGDLGLLEISGPSIVCALIAILAHHITNRFHADVDRAREQVLELGSYELERQLGAGGMGEVWLAHHRMLKRPAAIKLIDPERMLRDGYDPQLMLERFEREALATARLRSAHTVELYDFGRTDLGSFYYAMELLDGIDLEELVREFGPQSPGRVVHILRQACCSLAEAHDNELIHRDIKPANIFLCRQGRELDVTKVLDFGLVLHTGIDYGKDRNRLTRQDQISGTPAYMAPEVALGERDYDHRVDIYALGCVALWLLSGTAAFERSTPMKTLLAHVNEPIPDIAAICPQPIPPALAALIHDCLAKKPDDRPSDMNVLITRLDVIAADLPWERREMAIWWAGIETPGTATATIRKATTKRIAPD